MNKQSASLTIIVAILAAVVLFGSRFFVSVPAGHVAVATLFGEVQDKPYQEGLTIPVNPLFNFTFYDIREKELKESAGVPSQDQLTTTIDVSIKFRINGSDAARILQETGTFEDAIRVQIQPKLRSVVREQGKSVVRAEDFFLQETQENLQTAIFESMSSYLSPRGITCLDILIRDINLPSFITRAIESKKEREQEVEKQKAEQEKASERKSLVGTGDRSEKIRTYNFPQGRITDHRIKLTQYNIEGFLDGDINEMVESLKAQNNAEKLSEIENQ